MPTALQEVFSACGSETVAKHTESVQQMSPNTAPPKVHPRCRSECSGAKSPKTAMAHRLENTDEATATETTRRGPRPKTCTAAQASDVQHNDVCNSELKCASLGIGNEAFPAEIAKQTNKVEVPSAILEGGCSPSQSFTSVSTDPYCESERLLKVVKDVFNQMCRKPSAGETRNTDVETPKECYSPEMQLSDEKIEQEIIRRILQLSCVDSPLEDNLEHRAIGVQTSRHSNFFPVGGRKPQFNPEELRPVVSSLIRDYIKQEKEVFSSEISLLNSFISSRKAAEHISTSTQTSSRKPSVAIFCDADFLLETVGSDDSMEFSEKRSSVKDVEPTECGVASIARSTQCCIASVELMDSPVHTTAKFVTPRARKKRADAIIVAPSFESFEQHKDVQYNTMESQISVTQVDGTMVTQATEGQPLEQPTKYRATEREEKDTDPTLEMCTDCVQQETELGKVFNISKYFPTQLQRRETSEPSQLNANVNHESEPIHEKKTRASSAPER